MAWKNDQVNATETERIIDVARKCLMVPGDMVELGCYKGDTSLLIAEVLQGSGKRLWVYDSFEGLPDKSAEDESAAGVDFKAGELLVSKREVKLRFLRAGLPVPVIKKAWFEDLTDADLPEQICFAFLDGDFYSSIKVSLELVAPRMAQGGTMIVHDYNNVELPGVTRAVDEFLARGGWKMANFGSLALLTSEC